MKVIFIKCCDDCPYCEIERVGEGHDIIAICGEYGFSLIDPFKDKENIDIVIEIHPECALKDFEI